MSVRILFGLAWFALAAACAEAQVAYPAAPETYEVEFRYRIRADRDERIRQYRAMTAELDKLEFKPVRYPNDDLEILDPIAEKKSGTIPAKNIAALAKIEFIKTVLVRKAGDKTADAKKPVEIRIRVAANFTGREQRLFHEQTVTHLGKLGFAEAIAYDHAGFTLVRGSIPAGAVSDLLKDLRTLPAGWLFSGESKDSLPIPFNAVVPLKFIEVLPDLPTDVTAFTLPLNLGKFSAEAKTLLDDPARAEKPALVELVFESDLGISTRDERLTLKSLVPGASIEGIVGRVATVRVPKANLVGKLADYSEVRHIRLPREATETARAMGTTAKEFVAASNLAELHKLGFDGRGIRVVVLASEFPDLQKLIGKGLPANTKLFDLTAEVGPTMEPLPAQPGRVGTGTATALALASAAPKAEIVCVRIDPSSFHQPLTVAKAVVGDLEYSVGLVARSEELTLQADRLSAERRTAVERYRKAFATLSDDPKVKKERDDAAAQLKDVQKREGEFKTLSDRFTAIKNGLESLRGAGLVVNTLVWESGYPHDGLSDLGQYLDLKYTDGAKRSSIKANKRTPTPTWIQAASISDRQIWTGAFLDADDNGVMEFGAPPAAGSQRWTPELNFLKYAPAEGMPGATLPKESKIRVSVQWREPHDENSFLPFEPIFPIRLRLMKQLDPDAKAFATDEFVEVARSVGPPVRLSSSNTFGTYEASFDVVLPAAGVYALRVEGGLATGGLLKASQRNLEIRPRIFLQMLDSLQSAQGVVRFDSYAPTGGGVGLPGDSAAAIVVGRNAEIGSPLSVSVIGSGPGVAISGKPEWLTVGEASVDGKFFTGTAISAGHAGGLAASLLSAGVRPGNLNSALGWKSGAPLVLPKAWIETLTPRSAGK